MRRIIPIALFATLPAMAQAHAGHVGEVAGHTHWVAGGLIAAAALVALWIALSTRKRAAPEAQGDDEADNEAEPHGESAEQSA